MSETSFCPKCKRELTGALDLVFTDVGSYSYLVSRETTDCNWRQCRGCKMVLCKRCDDEQSRYCCSEGRIVARERAGAALTQQNPETNQPDHKSAV
jgi:hypothetical protein